MPIDNHARRESEPPAGGIFLPKFSYQPTSELLASFEADTERSRKAQDYIRYLVKKYPPDNPLEPGIFTKAAERCNDYVRLIRNQALLRESTVIDWRVSDPMLRRKIKKTLHPSNPLLVDTNEQRKWRDWLGTVEEQDAYLRSIQVAPDYEQPHPLLTAEAAYTENLMEQAGVESDRVSLVRQRSDTYTGILMNAWPDFSTVIGDHYYEVQLHPYGKVPHMVRVEPDEHNVHFTDAGFPEDDYQTIRHASITDQMIFLQDCLIEFEPEG